MEDNCLFCKIIKGEIPSRKVFESENILAFLDISPIAEGHTVVIPKKHFVNTVDFPDEEMAPFFIDLKKVALKLKDKLGADGFNILQNNFRAAGQLVDHFHYHIVPRKTGDNRFKFPEKLEVTDEDLDAVLKKID